MRLSLLCIFLTLLLLLLLKLFHEDVNAFSIKLLHKDSPDSPVYPGRLTLQQRFHRLHRQTDARLRYLAAATEITSYTNHTAATLESGGVIRPQIIFEESSSSHYLLKVGIGTFSKSPSYMTYYLVADTGSELIWTQCQGCKSCFPQNEPLYPSSTSTTFRYLSCNQDSLCEPGKCEGEKCSYFVRYATKQSSTGLLGKDHFTFDSLNGTTETVDGIVFGCGQNQLNFDYNSTRVAGILGLGTGPRSLVKQLGSRAQGLFSYCIPYQRSVKTNNLVLRFGEDAKFQPGTEVGTTPLVPGPLPTYYVDLLGISFGEHRLEIPVEEFRQGCVLDGGSAFTSIPLASYSKLKQAADLYFQEHHIHMVAVPGSDLMCYESPQTNGFGFSLPTITFHFKNADLVVGSGGFLVFKSYFCLGIKAHQYPKVSVIIGNFAQSDKRFLFDLTKSTVSFAKQDCSTNS